MSGFATAIVGRLPGWLAPRGETATGRALWRAETTVLVVLGLFLAVVAINDIFWSVDDSRRLVADQMTWRHYTHRDYYNVSAGALVVGQPTDVSCANSSPGPPGERSQICILVIGPIRDGLRSVGGGFMLPARTGDFAAARYDCYGTAVSQRLCVK